MFTRLNRLDLVGCPTLRQPNVVHNIGTGHGLRDGKLNEQGPLQFDTGGPAYV